MARDVPEWIGRTPSTPVPERVKLRVLRRYNNCCYLTGKEIRPGDKWEMEHIHSLILGGENRERNLAPALADAHKRKTAAEMKVKAKTDRLAKKHMGIKKKSQGWSTRYRQRMDGSVVDKSTGEIVKEGRRA